MVAMPSSCQEMDACERAQQLMIGYHVAIIMCIAIECGALRVIAVA
jgi:hypothetical protein